MAPKFPKLLKTSREIGDRRIHKVLYAMLDREKKAYKGDESSYNERIGEIRARVEYRHDIILELQRFERDLIVDEGLADLINEEKEDLAEIGRLVQMSYASTLRATQKSVFMKKMKKLK
ncbi:hypothetical protein CTI12_AA508090 [Artemisia annua]|uniref:Uncharacterized protein n=1 Tax=Artemisia annua TaxID=35608 RepID=A0A2U1LB76_ARTAN|nr:hypothetical protein CTI12_AA508090 [Artemisia annua]